MAVTMTPEHWTQTLSTVTSAIAANFGIAAQQQAAAVATPTQMSAACGHRWVWAADVVASARQSALDLGVRRTCCVAAPHAVTRTHCCRARPCTGSTDTVRRLCVCRWRRAGHCPVACVAAAAGGGEFAADGDLAGGGCAAWLQRLGRWGQRCRHCVAFDVCHLAG